jgi:hypothetical protein
MDNDITKQYAIPEIDLDAILQALEGDSEMLAEEPPATPEPKKKPLRNFLRANGFVILSTSEFYESDTKYNHVVVEASITAAIED